MFDQSLRGVSVVVAGAGLSGLTAAYALQRREAEVTVFEARDRIGGRVWTQRDGFAEGQHAEAGADLINGRQSTIRRLVTDLGRRQAEIVADFVVVTVPSMLAQAIEWTPRLPSACRATRTARSRAGCGRWRRSGRWAASRTEVLLRDS